MKNAAVQVLCLLATLIAACQGFAQAPDYDFDWATITDIDNPAYGGGPSGQLAGQSKPPMKAELCTTDGSMA